MGGEERLDNHWDFIEKWMSKPLTGYELDYAGFDWHGQGRAYKFFEDLDLDVRQELGVLIVEGDCPGSDYFAAELHLELPRANEVAERLGLPFRFRSDGA